MFPDIDMFYFSCFFFEKNNSLIEKGNPSEKVLTVEKKLDCIDKDDIGNFRKDWKGFETLERIQIELCSSIRNVGIS